MMHCGRHARSVLGSVTQLGLRAFTNGARLNGHGIHEGFKFAEVASVGKGYGVEKGLSGLD